MIVTAYGCVTSYGNTGSFSQIEDPFIRDLITATEQFYSNHETKGNLITCDSIDISEDKKEGINKPKNKPFYKSIKRKLKRWEL